MSSKPPGSSCLARARSAAPSVGLPLRLFTTPRPTTAEGAFWCRSSALSTSACRGFVLVQFERLVEICLRLVQIVLQHEHPAAVDIALGGFGLDLDHLIVVGDGKIVLFPHAIEIAALGEAARLRGIELHLLVELDKRPVEIALVAIDDAAQQEIVAAAGIELDGLVEIGDGLVVILLGLEGR